MVQIKKRLLYPDLLKTIAIFGVILIHVSASFMYSLTEENKNSFITAMVLNFLFLWSVPVFIMISGMFLLKNSDENIPTFIKKRVSKVLIPFVSWCLLYYIYTGYFNLHPLSLNKETLLGFVKDVLTHKIFFHLWFVYMIIIMYVFTPILRKIVHKFRVMKGLLLVGTLFFLIPLTNLVSFLTNSDFRTWTLTINFIPYSRYILFIGYFVLGYYLSKITLTIKQKQLVYVFGLIGFIIVTFGTYSLTKNNGGILVTDLAYYLHPPVLLISIAIFVFFKDHFNNESNTFFNKLGDYSFQVYLMHMLILNLIIILFRDTYFFKELSQHTFIYIITITSVTYVTSNLIAFIISKIPILNKLL